MIRADNLSQDPSQLSTVLLADKSTVQIELVYRGATQRWSANISRAGFTVDGVNLCVHPNLLRPWRNTIPFGLACASADGADPIDLNDFVSQDGGITPPRINLYLLDSTGGTDEVHAAETLLFGGLV